MCRTIVSALVVSALVVSAFATGPGLAAPDEWVHGQHAAARLIDAGPGWAGVQVRLDPRFITYWRDPGEAGVPPVWSFEGSTNLATATVRYPAPRRFDEDGLAAFGYENSVVFPLALTPLDPAAPVRLALTLHYAACNRICIPLEASFSRTLGPADPDAPLVTDAVAALPRPIPIGADGPLSVRSVRTEGETLIIDATTPDAAADLFVEGPSGWFFATRPAVMAEGHTAFTVAILERPKDANLQGVPLTLTLTAADAAIETPLRLDGAPVGP